MSPTLNHDAVTNEMRTLLIGLGGTGGHVLHELFARMTEEERRNANCIYLDLDKNDTSALQSIGVRTCRISTADTVRNLADSLAPEERVYDWLPNGKADDRFSASGTEDGASQYRYKSRLCLTNFLSNPSNALAQTLRELCPPGIQISQDTLRVMIVSSVAGGTGSGTFIELALYIRKFFRSISHPEIHITGLLAFPELFSQNLTQEGHEANKRTAMCANAYAAIRELNAMNLAVSGEIQVVGGYGRSVNMNIHTAYGDLFNSKDPRFTSDYNTKPFNLLYFVDLANRKGGILQSQEQYYTAMADIAYVRLYSSMNGDIAADENNELSAHTRFPTAIYGSAGYSRIIYPYEDILRYLAERQTYNELDSKWFVMEAKWNSHVHKQRKVADASGYNWFPTALEREDVFINNMNKELSSPKSKFMSIRSHVGWSHDGSEDRVNAYLRDLNAAMATSIGLDAEGYDQSSLTDGPYGLGTFRDVSNARQTLVDAYNLALDSTDSYLDRLSTLYASATTGLSALAAALTKHLTGNAIALAGDILPSDADSSLSAETSSINLYKSLLKLNGKDVHPMAARYMLYRVRQAMREVTNTKPISCDEILKTTLRSMSLCLDQDPSDGEDTVDEIVESIKKSFWNKKSASRANLAMFLDMYPAFIHDLIYAVTLEMKRQTYIQVMEVLDELITQYEGLYDNMSQYSTIMKQRMDNDYVLYDDDDDRCIYIGASPEMLDHYSNQKSIQSILDSSSEEIYSAAGQSIFKSLLLRTQKALMQKERNLPAQDDHYDDLGHIFDTIVQTYSSYLRKQASYLQVTVMTALFRQCCNDCNLNTDLNLHSDISANERVLSAFMRYMQDLTAKAQPLLRYSNRNTDIYYNGESDVSILYHYLGMNSQSAEELRSIYNVRSLNDALSTLQNSLSMSKLPVVSSSYNSNEIFCFSAVHCLQPTQISMFREDEDDSYYVHYRKRLAEAAATHSLAETSHIDKRWHVRGALPYVSPKLEMEWNTKSVKALMFLALERLLCFRYDSSNKVRFYTTLNGRSTNLQWPHGVAIDQHNVSRLLEYLNDQEGLIEDLSSRLDTFVNYQISTMSNYTNSLQKYKEYMTKNPLLSRMRRDLLTYESQGSELTAGHGQNASKPVSKLASDEDTAAAIALYDVVTHESFNETEDGDKERFLDLGKTMGGLLEFAWMLHKSEELLNEDRDFGEMLLRCASDILKKFCEAMCGKDPDPTSATYANYVDLYSHSLKKFLQEYVIATARKRKLTPEQLTFSDRNTDTLGPVVINTRSWDLSVPDCIRNTEEYMWISQNWVPQGNVLKA